MPGTNSPPCRARASADRRPALFLGIPGVDSTNLGRPLSSGIPVEFLNIVEPGELYGDRLNSVDLRFGKILRYGNTRTLISLDVFNLLNSNTTDVYQRTYGDRRISIRCRSWRRGSSRSAPSSTFELEGLRPSSRADTQGAEPAGNDRTSRGRPCAARHASRTSTSRRGPHPYWCLRFTFMTPRQTIEAVYSAFRRGDIPTFSDLSPRRRSGASRRWFPGVATTLALPAPPNSHQAQRGRGNHGIHFRESVEAGPRSIPLEPTSARSARPASPPRWTGCSAGVSKTDGSRCSIPTSILPSSPRP